MVPPALSTQEVRVIGYHFPPFVNQSGTGFTHALIKTLNDSQDEYHFSFHLTSPARRYQDLSSGRGDVIFFEMPEWGWTEKDIQIEPTREILTGGEVYVALNKPGRNQSYFDDITSKRIAAFLSYHYGFAGFDPDRRGLEKNFDIYLTTKHTTNIRIMLAGRVDVTVVTEAFLHKYLTENPELKSRIMVSDKRDQTYSLKAFTRKGSPVTVEWLERFLNKIKKSGRLQALATEHDIEKILTY